MKALSFVIQKDMANVIVFENWVKLQGQGHKVKYFDTNRKVLS
jgi:hypothetical protein